MSIGLVALHGRAKHFVAKRLGLHDATLHAHGGMLIYLTAILLIGRGLHSAWPLAIVVAAELANELFDRLRTGSWRWADTLADIANTILWPAVVTGLAFSGLL